MQLPAIGDFIADKYRIEQVLGEGGFGRVYRGTANLTERSVAIKVWPRDGLGVDRETLWRFFEEAAPEAD